MQFHKTSGPLTLRGQMKPTGRIGLRATLDAT
jgi:hypothetical protein